MTNQIDPGYTDQVQQQAYNFEGGIEMIPVGRTTLINGLIPSQSEPCPSNLVKKSTTSDLSAE